jgi:hypothetical protein
LTSRLARRTVDDMIAVVLHDMPPNEDAAARALAGVLELTPVEARGRLAVPQGGPAIVARRGEPEAAAELVARLKAAGFRAFMVDADRVETDARRTTARRFTLGATAVQAETRTGDIRALTYADVHFLARATGIASQTTTSTVESRQFSAGRALVSGGLVLTKAKTTTTRETEESWEGWLVAYPRAGAAVVFRETETLWDGLGAALQPTRQANFTQFCALLRARCPAAVYDDRLMRRAGQVQLLGPGFAPESCLDLALSVLTAAPR